MSFPKFYYNFWLFTLDGGEGAEGVRDGSEKNMLHSSFKTSFKIKTFFGAYCFCAHEATKNHTSRNNFHIDITLSNQHLSSTFSKSQSPKLE